MSGPVDTTEYVSIRPLDTVEHLQNQKARRMNYDYRKMIIAVIKPAQVHSVYPGRHS